MRHPTCVHALVLATAFLAGCATVETTAGTGAQEDIRQIFVGTWVGEHRDLETQMLRTWVQERREDGTFEITFFHHRERGVFTTRHTGRWWIEGKRFFETSATEKKDSDVYEFEVLNEDEIRFSSLVKDYVFIDKRAAAFGPPKFI